MQNKRIRFPKIFESILTSLPSYIEQPTAVFNTIYTQIYLYFYSDTKVYWVLSAAFEHNETTA